MSNLLSFFKFSKFLYHLCVSPPFYSGELKVNYFSICMNIFQPEISLSRISFPFQHPPKAKNVSEKTSTVEMQSKTSRWTARSFVHVFLVARKLGTDRRSIASSPFLAGFLVLSYVLARTPKCASTSDFVTLKY